MNIPVTAPWMACLCAAWCRTCDGYRPVLEAVVAELRAEHPGLQVRWVDIEDEADLLGDIDIETFPTLLIADGASLRFFGPVTPQAETLRRLLRATLVPVDRPQAAAPALQALVDRLRPRG